MTIDDIEKQKFRTRSSRKSLEPAEVLRDHGYSIVEQAYFNTTSKLYSIASVIYDGYTNLTKIMAVDQDEEPERPKRGRKKVVIKSDHSDSEENYQTAYGRSKSRARSRTLE